VGVGSVDILAVSADGSSPLWTDVPFGGVGDTLDVPAGAYRVGLDTDADGSPNLVASLPALAGGSYANVVATIDSVGAATLVVQLGDGSTVNAPLLPFDNGTDALVRAVYVGNSLPNVDIEFNGPASADAQNVESNEVTQWFSLPPGDYEISASGGAGFVNGDAELTLSAGGVYSVVVYGTDDFFGFGVGIAALKDDYSALAGRQSRIRTAHLASAVGEVDAFQIAPTENALAQNVILGAIGGWFGTLSGPVELGVDADNDGQYDITWSSPNVPPGRAINTVVTDGDNGETEVFLFTRMGSVELNPN